MLRVYIDQANMYMLSQKLEFVAANENSDDDGDGCQNEPLGFPAVEHAKEFIQAEAVPKPGGGNRTTDLYMLDK